MGTVTPKGTQVPEPVRFVMGPAVCIACRQPVWLYWCLFVGGIGWLPGQPCGGVYQWREERGDEHRCGEIAAAA